MGHKLYAVIYRDSWTEKTKAGKDKKRPTTFRGFLEVGPDHDNVDFIGKELARLEPQWVADDVLPSEEVPPGNDRRPHTYGMEKWVKMFNPRQQLAHGHCVEAFRECVDEDRAGKVLDERRKAAWAYIGIAIDKLISTNSLQCRWHPNRQVVAGTFDRHDFGFKWSYTEMAITCQGLGLEWSLNDVGGCLSELLEMTNQGDAQEQMFNPEDPAGVPAPSEVINSEAQFISQMDDGSVDCIVFDPPYHGNVAYAELSDFFYVWLKRTADPGGYMCAQSTSAGITRRKTSKPSPAPHGSETPETATSRYGSRPPRTTSRRWRRYSPSAAESSRPTA